MPVILLKYRPDIVSDETMFKLVAELPIIVSGALDVPDDPGKRLRPEDIQVWALPPNKFDINVKGLQLMIPLHYYPERVVNLEARKDAIVSGVRQVLGNAAPDIGWVWILPSQDTAFGRIGEPTPTD